MGCRENPQSPRHPDKSGGRCLPIGEAASCSYSHVVATSIFTRAMVAPENDLSRVTGEANHSLRIRARAYSLSLSDDSLFLLVDDADGRRWGELFLGGSIDRPGETDALTTVGTPHL